MATKTAEAPPAQEAALIVIDKIVAETITVPIRGTSPLLVHRFGEKAKRIMLDRMQGRTSPKEPKNPEAEYQAAFYMTRDGHYGFPVLAFKDATVQAARFYDKSITMTALRQFMFFHGELGLDGSPLVVIEGEPVMREDVVRLSRRGTDLRYRPMFSEWRCSLRVTYITAAITRNSVISLIDAGGMSVGVGEWRPEKGGIYGTYQIDPDRAIEMSV